jgi:hypothetical protein
MFTFAGLNSLCFTPPPLSLSLSLSLSLFSFFCRQWNVQWFLKFRSTSLQFFMKEASVHDYYTHSIKLIKNKHITHSIPNYYFFVFLDVYYV